MFVDCFFSYNHYCCEELRVLFVVSLIRVEVGVFLCVFLLFIGWGCLSLYIHTIIHVQFNTCNKRIISDWSLTIRVTLLTT